MQYVIMWFDVVWCGVVRCGAVMVKHSVSNPSICLTVPHSVAANNHSVCKQANLASQLYSDL